MSYLSYQKDLEVQWDNFLTELFGPTPDNPVIGSEQDLRDLEEGFRARIEGDARKWMELRERSAIEARFHYLD